MILGIFKYGSLTINKKIKLSTIVKNLYYPKATQKINLVQCYDPEVKEFISKYFPKLEFTDDNHAILNYQLIIGSSSKTLKHTDRFTYLYYQMRSGKPRLEKTFIHDDKFLKGGDGRPLN